MVSSARVIVAIDPSILLIIVVPPAVLAIPDFDELVLDSIMLSLALISKLLAAPLTVIATGSSSLTSDIARAVISSPLHRVVSLTVVHEVCAKTGTIKKNEIMVRNRICMSIRHDI